MLPLVLRLTGVFLSTPSARRATGAAAMAAAANSYFYPRPPRGGRRGDPSPHRQGAEHFYPRPPRGGRPSSTPPPTRRAYFYPRPPRGGRRPKMDLMAVHFSISIHALREEGDLRSWLPAPGEIRFLSTPSARRATMQMYAAAGSLSISIHALREEGDSKKRDKISIFKQIIQHSARI